MKVSIAFQKHNVSRLRLDKKEDKYYNNANECVLIQLIDVIACIPVFCRNYRVWHFFPEKSIVDIVCRENSKKVECVTNLQHSDLPWQVE